MHYTSELAIPKATYDINNLKFYNQLSFLKTNITYAQHVTTVNRHYT